VVQYGASGRARAAPCPAPRMPEPLPHPALSDAGAERHQGHGVIVDTGREGLADAAQGAGRLGGAALAGSGGESPAVPFICACVLRQ
jgi:hypothetical protein